MVSKIVQFGVAALAGLQGVMATGKSGLSLVKHEGEPMGVFKNISGIQIYHSNPPKPANVSFDAVVIYVTDIYGVPLLQNKLLADSFATSYPVLMPDLFYGDAIPLSSPEGPALNLTAWRGRHPPAETDAIIAATIKYAKEELGAKRIGALGYCFGGKFVPRWLASGKGIDVGFIAHPSFLEVAEIQGIAGAISIAAGELDGSFNATARRVAEDLLQRKNATYQSTVYSGAPHGFAVRPDLTNKRQKFAKEAAFLQALSWFEGFL